MGVVTKTIQLQPNFCHRNALEKLNIHVLMLSETVSFRNKQERALWLAVLDPSTTCTTTVSCDQRDHRACSELKTLAVVFPFGLSINEKVLKLNPSFDILWQSQSFFEFESYQVTTCDVSPCFTRQKGCDSFNDFPWLCETELLNTNWESFCGTNYL